jgi:DNA-binding MarR family transcriptional regulator
MPHGRENFRAMIGYATTASRSMKQEATPSLPVALYGIASVSSPPTVSELAAMTGLTLKNTSRVVKELRKRGWIDLQGNPLDERVKLVTLTVDGSEVVRLVNRALVDMALRIIANEDGRGAKQGKRRPRLLTNRARAKAALMGRLIKTTPPPVQRRTKAISTR